jgi:excisionase family DNA binding protein
MSEDLISTSALLTIPEVAAFLKVSPSGVRRLVYGRQLSFHKVGGSIRISLGDIQSYLERQRIRSIDQ